MPKDLSEFNALEEVTKRKGGRKVNWKVVIDYIVKSGKAWTVKEVHEHKKMVNKKVTRYRTKSVLDKNVEDGILEVRDDKKRYWYCKKGGDSGG